VGFDRWLVTGTLAGAMFLGLLGIAVGAAPAAVAGHACHNAVQTLRGGSSAREAAFVGPATWAQTAEVRKIRRLMSLRPCDLGEAL
jgi:hypothetical protein